MLKPVDPKAALAVAAMTALLVGSAGSALAADASGLTELVTAPPAPQIELRDIDGRRHRLSDLRGKVVLVNFWASWCPPCRAEMPSLQRLWDRLRHTDFVVLAIAAGESKRDVVGFDFSLPARLTFTLLPDPDFDATQYWPVRGLPASFVIDTRGRVTHVAHGARRWDSPHILALLRTLIDTAPGSIQEPVAAFRKRPALPRLPGSRRRAPCGRLGAASNPPPGPQPNALLVRGRLSANQKPNREPR